MPQCLDDQQWEIVKRAKELITTYEDMAELIRLGAYRKGSDAKVDEAIQYYDAINAYLAQNKDEQTSIDEGFALLAQILGMPYGTSLPHEDNEAPPPSEQSQRRTFETKYDENGKPIHPQDPRYKNA